jgi:hypothetical protein
MENILNEKIETTKKYILTMICDQYEPNRGNVLVWVYVWELLGKKLSDIEIDIFAEHYKNQLEQRTNFKQDYADLLTKFRDFYSQMM